MSENVLASVTEAAEKAISLPNNEREALDLYHDFKKEIPKHVYYVDPKEYTTGRAILEAPPEVQIALLIELVKRNDAYGVFGQVYSSLIARKLPWTAESIEKFLHLAHSGQMYYYYYNSLLRPVERFIKEGNALTLKTLQTLRDMRDLCKKGGDAEVRKIVARITEFLGESTTAQPDRGETWADKALADLAAMTLEQQQAWSTLFAYALVAEGSKPTAKWREEGKRLVEAVGEETFDTHVASWFSVVTSPAVLTEHHNMNGYEYNTHNSTGSDANIGMLKGLAWLCSDRAASAQQKNLVRALGKLILGCIKKIPGTGPWGVRAASAGVVALTEIGTMDAVAQLGLLKTKVTFRTVLNAIESGLEAAAKKAGVTKADLEDMGIPAYGFDTSGVREENFGDCKVIATLSDTGDIGIEWFGANDKPVKAPPAEVKKNFAAELKEFKADMDAAAKTVTAQKVRFDGFYLPERVWKFSDWQERFGTHPLVSNIAYRLIWHFTNGTHKAQGLYNSATGKFEEVNGNPIDWLDENTEVRLWHPIGFSADEIIAWRNCLQERRITQPFKQAYREVYILTEAELRTQTYSNRFAGHLLKQHQMNALAALRGWKNALRLMVDDEYPPASKTYPELGIRVEYWIEGAGDDYGTHTTDSGTYLYLTTDQVRFYPIDAPENTAHAGGGRYEPSRWRNQAPNRDPLPLTEVPAILFSEAMRDVDMFVGVCSVGNDPTWRDGGVLGSFGEYWSDYSFGDLSATAQTRRTVLEKLLPRLKIAAQCELTDKFLVVRGSIRTYKIHLGSSNILMEPNDQYLCIVESRGLGKPNAGTQFLPYEGDQRLALILSKAFLLAEDTKITDETITRQLTLV